MDAMMLVLGLDVVCLGSLYLIVTMLHLDLYQIFPFVVLALLVCSCGAIWYLAHQGRRQAAQQ